MHESMHALPSLNEVKTSSGVLTGKVSRSDTRISRGKVLKFNNCEKKHRHKPSEKFKKETTDDKLGEVKLNIADLIVYQPSENDEEDDIEPRAVVNRRLEKMHEEEEKEYDCCGCCFCLIKTRRNPSRYAKGYTGQQPQRKHRPPQAPSFETSETKTGPYHHVRKRERKDQHDDRGFYIFIWSAAMGVMKTRDVQNMNHMQLRFLLPILLQFGHLYQPLLRKMRLDRRLRMEVFFWLRSNPDPVAKEYRDGAFRKALSDEFEITAIFYENEILKPTVAGQHEEGTQIFSNKASIAIPLENRKEICFLDRAIFKKKFASGHGPILVELMYFFEGPQISPGRALSRSPRAFMSVQTKRTDHKRKLGRSQSERLVHLFNNGAISFSKSREKILRRQTSTHDTHSFKRGHSALDIITNKTDHYEESFKTKFILIKPDAVCRAASVCRMMELFNYLWNNSWMHGPELPHALSYAVVPGGENWGFIECIKDVQSVKEFDFTTIEKLNARAIKDSKAQQQVNTFLKSVVGGLVAGHVLGLRDRHSDNILISEGYKFYHIDFKHCFNLQTKVLDAPSMVIPKGLHRLLVKMKHWERFLDRCVEAFTVLRRSSEHLIQISQLMFAGQVDPAVIDKSYIQCFWLGVTEQKAKINFRYHVTNLPGSLSSKLKEFVHANSPNVRSTKAPSRKASFVQFQYASPENIKRADSQGSRLANTPSPQNVDLKFSFRNSDLSRRSRCRSSSFGKFSKIANASQHGEMTGLATKGSPRASIRSNGKLNSVVLNSPQYNNPVRTKLSSQMLLRSPGASFPKVPDLILSPSPKQTPQTASPANQSEGFKDLEE
eukprot:CAMPEP_0184486164 /NCGR_PEP_ID=MMETSP0113_2-20130426/7700_1 /TAXON_ID=91329 /ORGANISM="Norrisiella sphaerica, Strain BC52" /LENGTH=832 /DNA_ID=CAMNT_0026867913 /DNA_START=841 /DNA_END=3339 /DNA_ORIENTATION=+